MGRGRVMPVGVLFLTLALASAAVTCPSVAAERRVTAPVRQAECRALCGVAIENCVQDGTAPLVGEGLSGKRLRRKARHVRRACHRKARRRCKHEGVHACGTPLSCVCKG